MSDDQVFDEQAFSSLSDELGIEDTVELLIAFLSDTNRKIEACVGSVIDRASVQREAHAVKSSAATFGFTALSTIALRLEKGAATMRAAEFSDGIAALRAAFDDVSRLAHARLLSTMETAI